MEEWVSHAPQKLREQAERCLRIAATSDHASQEALTKYARELLERADRMEAAIKAGEPRSESQTGAPSNPDG
jgi:hypothetical protein